MNIEKYTNNTTQTSEGVIYKYEEAFKIKSGICLIGEYALGELEEMVKNAKDMSDEELIECGIADTYGTIILKVESRWGEFDEEVQDECTPVEIAEDVFNNALWTCISTEIDQMAY